LLFRVLKKIVPTNQVRNIAGAKISINPEIPDRISAVFYRTHGLIGRGRYAACGSIEHFKPGLMRKGRLALKSMVPPKRVLNILALKQ